MKEKSAGVWSMDIFHRFSWSIGKGKQWFTPILAVILIRVFSKFDKTKSQPNIIYLRYDHRYFRSLACND